MEREDKTNRPVGGVVVRGPSKAQIERGQKHKFNGNALKAKRS